MKGNELNDLPVSAKNLFNEFYSKVSNSITDELEATKVAWELTKENYSRPSTAKSITYGMREPSVKDNYIDVMLGKPYLDEDGDILDFWDMHPMHPIIGDMEHMYLEKSNGVYDKEFDKFEGFTPVADRFYNADDGSLWAKVEIPKHEFTPEFLRRWENGDYGVSVEYSYPDYGVQHKIENGNITRRITEGTIKGFTFTTDPAIKETKIKNGK